MFLISELGRRKGRKESLNKRSSSSVELDTAEALQLYSEIYLQIQ